MVNESPIAVLVDATGSFHSARQEDFISGSSTPGLLTMQMSDNDGKAYYLNSSVDLQGTGKQRLMVDAVVSNTPEIIVVTNPPGAALYREFLKSFGSDDMVVNGSVIPVTFTLNALPTQDLVLREVRLVMTANTLNWGGNSFGKGGGALSNGVDISYEVDGNTVDLGTLTTNEDILMLPSRNDVTVAQAGNRDIIALSIDLAGLVTLAAGSSDHFDVVINDDLTTGARDISYFKFAGFGNTVDV